MDNLIWTQFEYPGDVAMAWERNFNHSIRPDFTDGFLFPYSRSPIDNATNCLNNYDSGESIILKSSNSSTVKDGVYNG